MRAAQKWYTRIIGIFFVLIVLSLVSDLVLNGYSLETWHKVFHVVLGIVVLAVGWNNARFWKPFCLANGAFFVCVAVVGLLFPNLGGLAAFNTTDTVLHALVGMTGLVIGAGKVTNDSH